MKATSANRPKKQNIGFIFLDEIHHINHFITIAIALAKTNKVSILTFPSKHIYLKDSLKRLNGENVILEELTTKTFRAFTDQLKKKNLVSGGCLGKASFKVVCFSVQSSFI